MIATRKASVSIPAMLGGVPHQGKLLTQRNSLWVSIPAMLGVPHQETMLDRALAYAFLSQPCWGYLIR